MGRYLEAADDDEPCKWIKTDTGPVTTLLFVSSLYLPGMYFLHSVGE
jgi:hypothetical protein